MHEPGLAVLLLPVHAAASWLAETVPPARLAAFRMTPVLFAYALVSLFMLALTCVGLWLLVATLARRVPPGHARAATLLVALSPPILSQRVPRVPGHRGFRGRLPGRVDGVRPRS